MKEYHKIHTLFKRDMEKKHKPLVVGKWSKPEFEMLKDVKWIGTEKIDGTNVRVMFYQHKEEGFDEDMKLRHKLEFRGKTDRAQMPMDLIKRLNDIFTIEKLKEIFKDASQVCLYGEGYGGKIQKGGKYGDTDFILFDIKIGNWWLERKAIDEIAKILNIKSVPVIFEGTLDEAIKIAYNGFNSVISDEEMLAEGLILEPEVQLFNRKRERIITKIKYKDFKNAEWKERNKK